MENRKQRPHNRAETGKTSRTGSNRRFPFKEGAFLQDGSAIYRTGILRNREDREAELYLVWICHAERLTSFSRALIIISKVSARFPVLMEVIK